MTQPLPTPTGRPAAASLVPGHAPSRRPASASPTPPAAARAARISLAGLALVSGPALAHHAMDGETPTTFSQGLLSGLAHPVIGLDHLAFVLGLAWLLSMLPAALRLGLAAAFVIGSLLGTAIHLQSVDLPAVELLVSLTVLAAGIAVLLRRAPPVALLWIALPLAGVFHGYAYGESIIGAEAGALAGYLIGFALIQFGLIAAIGTALSKLEPARFRQSAVAAGLIVALVGLFFSLQQFGTSAA